MVQETLSTNPHIKTSLYPTSTHTSSLPTSLHHCSLPNPQLPTFTSGSTNKTKPAAALSQAAAQTQMRAPTTSQKKILHSPAHHIQPQNAPANISMCVNSRLNRLPRKPSSKLTTVNPNCIHCLNHLCPQTTSRSSGSTATQQGVGHALLSELTQNS